MRLNDWFQTGMTAEGYIASMQKNKQEMLSIYEKFSMPTEDKRKLEALKSVSLRVIVLTEDWCGDALLNIPILMRIAETADIEVRFLLRDQNLELMDEYLTNGTSRAIPIFIFLNQAGEEVGVWGPRATEVQTLVEHERSLLPEKGAADFQEKQLEMYKRLTKSYQTDSAIWEAVSESIISLLTAGIISR
ncbi:thioredoxin family protein [Bacillus rubiinfantis]|uniref:thioredoxin family protein n=1 Tax=Bacillus rubiinfantis TaxID=1499680 RepID=UPI0005A9FE48|nr:thioredoxin family protein [Bacillus rubiinfantis]